MPECLFVLLGVFHAIHENHTYLQYMEEGRRMFIDLCKRRRDNGFVLFASAVSVNDNSIGPSAARKFHLLRETPDTAR